MEKRKVKLLIFWILFTGIVIFIGIYGGYQVGSDKQYAKTHMTKQGFVGTYPVGEIKYICILGSSNNEFYLTDTDKTLDEGTYEFVNNSSIILKNKEDKIVFTIMYSDNKFWVVDLKSNKIYKIKKIGEASILPSDQK